MQTPQLMQPVLVDVDAVAHGCLRCGRVPRSVASRGAAGHMQASGEPAYLTG